VSYEIELTRRAEKEILKLDAAIFEQIRAAIDGLDGNPSANSCPPCYRQEGCVSRVT